MHMPQKLVNALKDLTQREVVDKTTKDNHETDIHPTPDS
jgi:hypothetical protein